MWQLKNVVRWIVNALTCFLLAILALVIYGKCVLMFTDSKYPNYFGYTLFEVASGSMEPTLYINDVILIKIKQDGIEKDDIIAFVSDNAIITHRVVFIDGDTITVKGDKNNTIDRPIDRSQIIGEVIKVFPKFGIWKKVVTEPKILIAIFITLILFDFALSYNKQSEISKKDNVVISEVKNDDVKNVTDKDDKKKEKDVIDANKLLELTRKIDITEINKLLESDDIRLNKKEITNLQKQLDDSLEKTQELPKLNKKEQQFLEYTMRLDLNSIQKKIKNKIK